MNDKLAHNGILGMKWGNRRFQNPDGTLTEEGRRRYLKNPNKRRDGSSEEEGGKVTIAKPKKKMSRSEIRKREKAKKQKAAAEAARKKQEEIEENRRNNILMDPRRLSKHFNDPKYNYSKKEIQEAYDRFRLEDQIMDLAKKRKEPPTKTQLDKGKEVAQYVLDMMRIGVNAYEQYREFQNLMETGNRKVSKSMKK